MKYGEVLVLKPMAELGQGRVHFINESVHLDARHASCSVYLKNCVEEQREEVMTYST